MKRTIIVLALFIHAITAHAASVLIQGGADDIRSTKYGDAYSISGRIEQPVAKSVLGTLSVAGEVDYLSKSQHTIYGDLSSVALIPELVYRPFDWRFSPYIGGGYGYYFHSWDRSEYLKSADISVDLHDSWGRKVFAGAEYKLTENWSVNFEVGYYKADYQKNAYYPDGTQSAVIGDSTIGNEGVEYSGGVRFNF